MATSSRTILTYSSWEIVPRALAKASVNMANTVTCPVNAFVEATPISGPTWM